MGNLQSNPSSSTATIEKKYEVFLSFRGATRYGFTNNLYEALRAKSIETFMDHRLEIGDEILDLLEKIRESKISVVIFSEEYASSKWCLRELVEIMECKEKNGQTVIPVFYNVAVSDVRHQKGSFKEGFDQLEKKFYEELAKDNAAWPIDLNESCMASFQEREKEFLQEMQKWRDALKKASDIKGCESSQIRPDSKLVSELVRQITEKLMSEYMPLPSNFEGLFGIEERFKQVMSLLCLDNNDIRIIGIWGMGGLGKTTLADVIHKQIPETKYGICFIRFVRERLEQCEGLVSVQKEVLSKVLNDHDIKLDGVTLPQHIKERLCRKKVFIVLDDVDSFLKLQELARGLNQLGPGSRIIITTRDKLVLKNCGVNDDYIYEVKGLSYQEAHMMFREYAFGQSPPNEDLMALSHEILRAIDGNPLGLKVAGSSLLGSNKQQWENALSRLKRSSEILKVLQISYDGLEDDDKSIFLDIACFYVGEREDYVAKLLDCSYSLELLAKRSLITISNHYFYEYKIIHMHDLLQEMGREIVHKDSPDNPGNRSRLWTQEDVLDTLMSGDGTAKIRGIFLDMSRMPEKHLSSKVFENMKHLTLLTFYDSTFDGFRRYSSNMRFSNDLSYLPDKLRSLKWLGYPLKALPLNFSPEYLVELDLRDSNLEKLWEDTMHAPNFNNLRELNLRGCRNLQSFANTVKFPSLISLNFCGCINLTKISDLDAPLLEELDIRNCRSLLNFPSPVLHFNNLRELCMLNGKNIQSFPSKMHFPSLTFLDFHGCVKLTNFPRISGNIENLYMRKTAIDEVPSSIENLTKLVVLDLKGCTSLKHISINICKLKALRKLSLCNCSALECFLEISDKVGSLKSLNLSGTAIKKLHHSIENLNELHKLRLSGCKNLDEVPSSIENLTKLVELDLKGCTSLKHISINICKLKALRKLNLCNCSALEYFPEISDKVRSLKSLNLSGTAIKKLHHSIENLNKLQILWLNDCKNLVMLPISIYKLRYLSSLDLSGCSKLENLPGNLVTDLSHCGESATSKPPIYRLNNCALLFTNCLNLNKTAVMNIMELQINQHRDMTTKGCGTQAVDFQ